MLLASYELGSYAHSELMEKTALLLLGKRFAKNGSLEEFLFCFSDDFCISRDTPLESPEITLVSNPHIISVRQHYIGKVLEQREENYQFVDIALRLVPGTNGEHWFVVNEHNNVILPFSGQGGFPYLLTDSVQEFVESESDRLETDSLGMLALSAFNRMYCVGHDYAKQAEILHSLYSHIEFGKLPGFLISHHAYYVIPEEYIEFTITESMTSLI